MKTFDKFLAVVLLLALGCALDAQQVVNGYRVFVNVAAGNVTTPASGQTAIYVDSTTKKLATKDDGGTIVSYGAGGSSSQIAETVTSVNNAASPYTILSTDSVILCDASGGNVALTLPAASGGKRELTFKKTDNSANTCTVNRAGSDLIDGQTSVVIATQYTVQKIQDTASAVWSRLNPFQFPADGRRL
jgi:hypothetical protein